MPVKGEEPATSLETKDLEWLLSAPEEIRAPTGERRENHNFSWLLTARGNKGRRRGSSWNTTILGRIFLLTLLAMSHVILCDGFLPSSSTSGRSMIISMQDNPEENQPFSGKQETEPVRTIGGGPDLIFEMARQMLLWDETGDTIQPQQQANAEPEKARQKAANTVLPRWRPFGGVSNANPDFRTSAPMMNSQGYAGTIWRNVRKANKPSLWRHALRTYDRMGEKTAKTVSGTVVPETDTSTKLKVQRTNLHHEGALVACAKLGLWQKALQIYEEVEQESKNPSNYRRVFVTDNMVLSLIRSCVRGSRNMGDATLEERRAPLDACLKVLLEMEEKHGLPLVARHLNPIAAAFQKMGLNQAAADLLSMNLEDRTSGPEEENGDDPFNVNDVRAKDKGSYSLLVKGAVAEENWEGAVEALKTMTEAGLYPNSRNLNAWTEVSERKSKQRAARSWKKKRDEYWLESVR